MGEVRSLERCFNVTVSLLCGFFFSRKKDNSRLQETYMKIKINDVELIQGVYVKAASDEVKDKLTTILTFQ